MKKIMALGLLILTGSAFANPQYIYKTQIIDKNKESTQLIANIVIDSEDKIPLIIEKQTTYKNICHKNIHDISMPYEEKEIKTGISSYFESTTKDNKIFVKSGFKFMDLTSLDIKKEKNCSYILPVVETVVINKEFELELGKTKTIELNEQYQLIIKATKISE